MSESLTQETVVLIHQVSRRDRHQVPCEGEKPAGEGVGATHPEAASVGVALDLLAQAERRGRGTGAGAEGDGGDHRVAGAELPRLARPGMLAQVEAGGDLVVTAA